MLHGRRSMIQRFRPLPRRAAWLVGASLAPLAVACTEPVDCAAQPDRCPRVAATQELAPVALRRVGDAPAPATRAAVPPERAVPVVGKVLDRLPIVPVGGGNHGQRFLDLGQGATGAALLHARRAPGTLDEQVAANRMIILGIHKAAAAHDFAALKTHMSDRLAATVEPMLDKQGERFWRHLDKYAQAAEKSFEVRDEPGGDAEQRRIIVTLPGGEELKPILTKSGNGWKFDRF